jgi:hypothetical protein
VPRNLASRRPPGAGLPQVLRLPAGLLAGENLD